MAGDGKVYIGMRIQSTKYFKSFAWFNITNLQIR